MLLSVDIGNTAVSLGILKKNRVIEVYSIEVGYTHVQLQRELKKILCRIKKNYPKIIKAVLCSVVPDTLKLVERSILNHLNIKSNVIGRDLKVPIKNKYHKPKQVGQDRLVCAFAAKQIYGLPVIIIDFGTAITFDVVSKNGNYEGGIIIPGIRLSAESLYKKTALLPRINTKRGPKKLIGKDTQESILSGLYYGYGEMCRGLISQIEKKISGKPKVIVTGGHAQLMKSYISYRVTKIDNELVFKGIGLLAQQSSNK